MQVSNLPLKGTADWFPEEFQIRKYIFDTWRQVCESFGYQEYLTPLLEPADLYRAKSGEDVGGVELTTLVDRGGRELAIRPEMTPSVTRLISRIYASVPKPVRYFSIANFFRNENPQRGRNREFWQLNFDIFGSTSLQADLEILELALKIMLAFNPPVNSFELHLNNRKLIDAIIPNTNQRQGIVRLLDKYEKLPPDIFSEKLSELGVTPVQIDQINAFLSSDSPQKLVEQLPELTTNEGFQESQQLIQLLTDLGYSEWVKFTPNVIRGFDYYDGMVFEVFDNNPHNSRAMFGGGRYNGLATLFGNQSFPAVGCAPGDETTKLFLEAWNLLPSQKREKYYLPLLDQSLKIQVNKLANQLRDEGKTVITGFETQSVTKALEAANKLEVNYLVILGTQEAAQNKFTIKDLSSREQAHYPLKT